MHELTVAVLRQDGPQGASRWDRFSVPAWPGMTAIDALNLICERPITVEGVQVPPVAWACNCLEEVCGACAMRVSGVPRLACSAFALELAVDGVLTLEPLKAFPVVRDLIVDRRAMRDQLARFQVGHLQPLAPEKVNALYPYSQCVQCGCCLDACPNVGGRGGFVGAFIAGQLTMNGLTPAAREAMKARGGLAGCSGFGLCAKHCPKGVDLESAIAGVNRAIRKKTAR